MSAHTLIIDGGTTNVRITLLNRRGETVAVLKKEAGVAHTAVEGNNRQLKDAVREGIDALLTDNGLAAGDVGRCVAYGMITSAEGLLEIPHCIAPVDGDGLRRAMVCRVFPELAPFPIALIPGVRNLAGAVDLSNFSRMDMMRGEETEAVGLYQMIRPRGGCVFVLPGSHNKFVTMDAQGRILGCRTTLSGELLSALTHHTIVAGAVNHAFASRETYDREMALAGFDEARRSGVGRAAFAGRILCTVGKLPPEKISSYLLGAVLQTDVQALQEDRREDVPLYLAGKEPVNRALADVLRAAGEENVTTVSAEICARMGIQGALRIAGEG